MRQLDELQKHILTLDQGDDASQRVAIHALRGMDQEVWVEAPKSLMNPLVVSLQRVLRNGAKPPLVHKEIAIILGNLGPRSKFAVPHLIDMLRKGVPDCVREAAALALGRLGKEARDAVDPLVELCDGPTNVSLHAIRALSEIGCADQRVRTVLTTHWRSVAHSQNGLLQVALALCRLGIEVNGMLGFLTNHLMASQDEALRKVAVEALAWCGKDELDVAPALLVAVLSDKNEDVREKAQQALNQLNLTHAKAIVVCAQQLKDSLFAEAALRKSGQPAVPALTEVLASKDPAIRTKAARILACFGELAVDAVPALTAALRDKDKETRLGVAKALWNVTKKADDVVPVLIQLLEDDRSAGEDVEERRKFLQTVIEALWRIGPPAIAAVPVLLAKKADKNRLVSQSAQSAVQKIAPHLDK